jgi:release factor glutamine methyltransferase
MLGWLLEDAVKRFKASGINSAHLDARLLAAQALGWDGGKIIARLDHIPTSSQCKKLEEMVARRVDREPIALILGHREFWGLDFKVTTDVLSPRPDSETLVEAALAIKGINISELSMLDFGTGTGCLLLALLSELPKARGLGVDISLAALDVARGNAKNLGMESRAFFQVSNWDKDVDGLFDLVISNPPYIANNDYFSLEREITAFEPELSLVGGLDGLDCFRSLGPAIVRKLAEGGRALIEIGLDQQEMVGLILEKVGLRVCAIHKDLAGHPRVIEAELNNLI